MSSLLVTICWVKGVASLPSFTDFTDLFPNLTSICQTVREEDEEETVRESVHQQNQELRHREAEHSIRDA